MKKALIIIDIQNDYFENGAMTLVGSNEACENAKLLLDRFRAEKLPVIYIQHLATRPHATFFLPNTEGAKIHNEVQTGFFAALNYFYATVQTTEEYLNK